MTPTPKFDLGGAAPPEGEDAWGRLWRLLKRFIGVYTKHAHPDDPVAAAQVQPGTFTGNYDIVGHLAVDSLDVLTGTLGAVDILASDDLTVIGDTSLDGGAWVSSAGLATTAVNGHLWIPSCAGVPTGVPTTHGNAVALVADRTNNKIYAYLGGAWVALN